MPSKFEFNKGKMVPYPSGAIVPDRDLGQRPALECIHLGIEFGGLKAVDDFSLTIGKTEIAGLIGPNGAGKTTFFNCVTGIYTPTEGKMYLYDADGEKHLLNGKKPHKITAMGMARTFQNIRLWKTQTVFDNVLIAKHMRRSSGFFSATFRGNRKEEAKQREEVLELLRIVGLEDVKDELATSLPYGKQRRLEIARALATQPKLLLLDEPAAGMNPQETIELTNFIRSVRDEFGLTIFLIEHHMNLVMDISDRIYVIDFGKQIAAGVPAEIQNDQRVIDAYLGVDEDA